MKYLETFILALVAVFAPLKAAMWVCFTLILIDMITGIWAAFKRGEMITSSRMKRTIGKIFLYEISLAVAFLAQKYLIGDEMPVCKMVSALIGLTEMSSIFENIDSINGTPVFKALIGKLVAPK